MRKPIRNIVLFNEAWYGAQHYKLSFFVPDWQISDSRLLPSEEDKLCRHPCLPNKSKLFTPTKSAHSSRRTGRKLFCCFPPIPLLPTQRKRGAKKGGVFRHPSQINLKHGKKKKKPQNQPSVHDGLHDDEMMRRGLYVKQRERERFGE